jgi:PAS domain S-box-containing protein
MSELSESLRSRALAMLKTKVEDAIQMSPEVVARLLHELQVHQMELEIQNEELRQAQIELAHSRDNYSNLYEFAPVGYLTIDKQGVIEQANLTVATMLKVERKDLIGRKFSDLISDESLGIWHLHRRAVFAQTKTVGCELQMVLHDGASASFGLQSLAFRDDQGNITRCRTAIADVSDRRIAFDALSELNIHLDESLSDKTHQLDRSIKQLRLLSKAIAHLGEGVMITADHLDWPSPEILFVNKAMCRIAGYDADELLGKTPRILHGPATDSAVLERMRQELPSRGASLVELVNYRKDGTAYDVEILVTPLFDASGNRTNFVSIQRDVTERNRVAEALRREHEINRNILDTIQNVILILDTQGRILQFNSYLEKISGWKLDEVRGRDWFETFLPSPDHKVIRRLFDDALSGKRTNGNVNPILTKDGDMRYIEWYDSTLTDSDGRLIGLLCTGQDVTERRELERHIVDVSNEERWRIGTDLHDSVGQELTGLSMSADALLISLSRDSRPEVKIVEKIKAGLTRALSQVRTLSRGMNPVDIDGEGLMSALSELVHQLNELPGIRSTFQCDQPVLLRDNEVATQLYRIAQEAITNAIRHGKPDEIKISMERRDYHLILRIADNGIGIAASDSPPPGMGLRTMAYRARMIKADLQVRPISSGGTEVVCSILVDA